MAINKSDIKNWVIYKITSPSGRIYIGKTSNLHNRLNAYRRHNCMFQKALLNSFNKYGFNNHKFDIIDEFCNNISYANGKEIFWIRTFMCNFSKWPKMRGLNLTDGGEGMVGWKPSEDTINKMKEIHKNRSPEKKKQIADKINATRKLRYPTQIKRKPTKEETRLKQSLARKGKPTWNKDKKGLQIAWNKGLKGVNVAWNKGKDYSHLSAEERKEKFGKHNIGRTHNRGRKHSKEYCEAITKRKTGKPLEKKWKPILHYTPYGQFIREYKSIKDAAFDLGIHHTHIVSILKGKIKNPKHNMFKYKNVISYNKFIFQRRIFNRLDIKERIA